MQRVLVLVIATIASFIGIATAFAAPTSSLNANLARAAVPAPALLILTQPRTDALVTNVRYLGKKIRRHHIRKFRRARRWNIRRRPRFGRLVAGVTLGAVIAAAVAGTAPIPPSPDLCWNWAKSGVDTHGYWYYCDGD